MCKQRASVGSWAPVPPFALRFTQRLQVHFAPLVLVTNNVSRILQRGMLCQSHLCTPSLTTAHLSVFRSLKLYFVLRQYGAESLREYLRHHMALAQWFADRVREDPRFELSAPVRFGLICFRYAQNICSLCAHQTFLIMCQG